MLKVSAVGRFSASKGSGEGDDATSRVWCVRWNHTGSLLASCGDDRAVRVWKYKQDAPQLSCATVLDDSHTKAVRCVSFSHCGQYLASASFDSSVIIYQHEDGEFAEVNKLEGHESEVKCCAFSPSDQFLATCSRDKSVWFWQMDEDDDFQVSSILQPHSGDVKFCVWHPHDDILVSCSYDASIRFFRYDGEDWVTLCKLDDAHTGTVWSAAFDGEGAKLATVGDDRVVQIWLRTAADSSEWRKAASIEMTGSRWPLYSVAWNAVTGVLAVGGGDGTIRFIRVEQQGDEVQLSEVGVQEAHEDEVNCVAWHPSDPELLASSSDDGTIRLWKVEV